MPSEFVQGAPRPPKELSDIIEQLSMGGPMRRDPFVSTPVGGPVLARANMKRRRSKKDEERRRKDAVKSVMKKLGKDT